jgi:hypothetical protein
MEQRPLLSVESSLQQVVQGDDLLRVVMSPRDSIGEPADRHYRATPAAESSQGSVPSKRKQPCFRVSVVCDRGPRAKGIVERVLKQVLRKAAFAHHL